MPTQPFHFPQKLVVIGGTMETARRASVSAWNGFVDCNFLSSLCFLYNTCSVMGPTKQPSS